MDPYEDLGVERDAPKEEIRKAYRRKSMEHHPDKGGDPVKFHALVKAYKVLGDDDKRSRYDRGESLDKILNASPDNAALQELIRLFMQLIEGENAFLRDPFGVIISSSESTLSGLEAKVAAEHKKIAKYEKAKTKLRKKSGPNILLLALDAQIRGCHEDIAAHGEKKALVQKVIELARDYEFEVDKGFTPAAGFAFRFDFGSFSMEG